MLYHLCTSLVSVNTVVQLPTYSCLAVLVLGCFHKLKREVKLTEYTSIPGIRLLDPLLPFDILYFINIASGRQILNKLMETEVNNKGHSEKQKTSETHKLANSMMENYSVE